MCACMFVCRCVYVFVCVAVLFYSYWDAQTFRKLVRDLFYVMRATYMAALAHDISGGYSSIIVFHRVYVMFYD